MSKKIETLSLAAAGGIAVGFAVAIAVLLSALASPKNAEQRIAKLQEAADQAESLLKDRRAGASDPRDICTSNLDTEVATLRTAVSAAIDRAQFSPSGLQINAAAPQPGALTPIRLRFEASGSYESSLALLASLAAMQPKLFADAVGLTSKTSSVTLSFNGAVYCDA